MTFIRAQLIVATLLISLSGVTVHAASNLKDSVWIILEDYLGSYRSALFYDAISLGNRAQMREALFDPNLDVWIEPTLPKQADYLYDTNNPSSRVLRLRNLNMQDHKDLVHEFAHHLVYITGGIQSSVGCGLDETYAELLEDRLNWLRSLARFDETYRNMGAENKKNCKTLVDQWDQREEWYYSNGPFNNNLISRFRWQDAPNTCGMGDRYYDLNAADIANLDRRLNISVDIRNIKPIYEAKIERCRKKSCLTMNEAGGTVRACRSGPNRFIYEGWPSSQKRKWIRTCSRVCGWVKRDWM